MEAILETKRLYLREMEPEDFFAFQSIWGDEETMAYYPAPLDAAEVLTWIGRNRQRYETFGFGLWAVCLKDTDEVIGDCGLTMQTIDGTIRPELGCHIRRDCQRMGYAREAARAVRDWTFCNTPFGEIYSYMKAANEPSKKTALSWGCRYAGEYPDTANGLSRFYVISRKDWERELAEEERE